MNGVFEILDVSIHPQFASIYVKDEKNTQGFRTVFDYLLSAEVTVEHTE